MMLSCITEKYGIENDMQTLVQITKFWSQITEKGNL